MNYFLYREKTTLKFLFSPLRDSRFADVILYTHALAYIELWMHASASETYGANFLAML